MAAAPVNPMEQDSPAPELRGHRSLAAIVFTDGVGFSARMSTNEELSLDLIRRDLQLMRELCWKFEGRVLKSTGDGLLMAFSSAISAVACSLDIQKTLADAAALLPADHVLMHRIGVHLGDVFISEFDVMGTGVNIAARLQTMAEPGGICVSQTVYDVVKTGVALQATYLGPQPLKNISQPIPVYRIRAAAATESWESAEETEVTVATLAPEGKITTRFTPPEDRYGSITRTLEQHDNAERIKKLLYCLCRKQWPNDLQQLSPISLQVLVQEAHQQYATAGQLKTRLDSIVKSLSKPTQYSPLATAIVSAMANLYQDEPEAPRFLYQDVAQTLERDRNQSRLKKLLVCICRDTWENDPQALDRYPMVDLMQEIINVAPTIHHLQTALTNIVQTLNKQAEYEAVAQTILQQVGRLYPTYLEPAPAAVPAPPPPRQPLFRDLVEPAAVAIPTPMRVAPPAPAPPVAPVPVEPEPFQPLTVQLPDNLFDVRLEIFRYTNPLIAKLVLFSALHQKLPFTLQSWAILRLHVLDELLLELLTQVPTLPELEQRLYTTAQALEEPEQCSQAASAIVQGLRPLFGQAGTASIAQLVGQSPGGGGADAATQAWSGFGDDDAATCQFFVSPKTLPDSGESTCQLDQLPER